MKAFLFLCCFCISASCFGQGSFPKQFIGHWKGELNWYQQGARTPKKAIMQLIIKPADSVDHYTWQIIYGEKNEDNRPYLLKPVDTAKGHWVIDEKNGILLDQYWVGNRFTSAFTVGNNTIIDSYWIEGGRMMVEFHTISSKPRATTGGTSDDIPPVDSYSVKGYQKAVLKRVSNPKKSVRM